MKWNDLSMPERAEYIRLGVKSGITNIDSIRKIYNEYAEEGPKPKAYARATSELPEYSGTYSDSQGNKSAQANFIYVDEGGRPILTKDLDSYELTKTKWKPSIKSTGQTMLDDADAEIVRQAQIDQYVSQFTPLNFLGAAASGMNFLSPSQQFGAIVDWAQGEKGYWEGIGGNNSGFFTDKFAEEHPYWALAGNIAGDAALGLAGLDVIELASKPRLTLPKSIKPIKNFDRLSWEDSDIVGSMSDDFFFEDTPMTYIQNAKNRLKPINFKKYSDSDYSKFISDLNTKTVGLPRTYMQEIQRVLEEHIDMFRSDFYKNRLKAAFQENLGLEEVSDELVEKYIDKFIKQQKDILRNTEFRMINREDEIKNIGFYDPFTKRIYINSNSIPVSEVEFNSMLKHEFGHSVYDKATMIDNIKDNNVKVFNDLNNNFTKAALEEFKKNPKLEEYLRNPDEIRQRIIEVLDDAYRNGYSTPEEIFDKSEILKSTELNKMFKKNALLKAIESTGMLSIAGMLVTDDE